MLSTMSSVAHEHDHNSQRTALGGGNGNGPVSESEDDRLCAGCSNSVSSDTGGVVVAFGNSLWHVDCFKCAKCGNQVNADTNLLLLSDGSPVCANCYNCKVCKKPILDEAVMTGDDSFHAECFTCRSCKNRIDELVFAKTSQGFYCMKCHNERVARSRRHMAKQKQRERDRERDRDRDRDRERDRERERERERERAALGSSAGRSTESASEGVSGQRENEHATGTSTQPDVSRSKYASGGSSNESHGQQSQQSQSQQIQSTTTTTGEANGIAATTSRERRSGSPAPPPSVSVTVAGPSSSNSNGSSNGSSGSNGSGSKSQVNFDSRSRANSHDQEALRLYTQQQQQQQQRRRASLENGSSSVGVGGGGGGGLPPPPPYSKTSSTGTTTTTATTYTTASSGGGGGGESARSSLSVSVSVSQESSSNSNGHDGVSGNRNSGGGLSLPGSGPGSGQAEIQGQSQIGDGSNGSNGLNGTEIRRGSIEDSSRQLQPKVTAVGVNGVSGGGGGNGASATPTPTPGLLVKKREKRASINPGLQLEASKMFSINNNNGSTNSNNTSSSSSPSPGSASASSPSYHQRPTSPSSSSSPPSASSPSAYARAQSPGSATQRGGGGRESPRVTSPLRDYFVGLGDGDGDGSASPRPSSQSQSQQHTGDSARSPTSPRGGAGITGAGALYQNSHTQLNGFHSKTSEGPTKFPVRSDSLQGEVTSGGGGGGGESSSNSAPPSARAFGLPSSPYNGRLFGLGSSATTTTTNGVGAQQQQQLRAQRSFDVRGLGSELGLGLGLGSGLGRSTSRSTSTNGNGNGKTIRSRSVSPKPPDVPQSVDGGESGGDVYMDGDLNGNGEIGIGMNDSGFLDGDDERDGGRGRGRDGSGEGNEGKGFWQRPPVPPPKDSIAGVNSTMATTTTNNDGGDELFSSEKEHTSAVTERTSGYFVTPALPPVRFSMSGMDLSEILSNIGSSGSGSFGKRVNGVGAGVGAGMILEDKKEENESRGGDEGNVGGGKSGEAERRERGGEDVAMAKTPTSATSTITPLGDIPPSSSTTTANSENMNGIGSNNASGSNSSGGAERKNSMKIKRVPPPEIYPTNGNGVFSATTSPTSPLGFGGGERRSSLTMGVTVTRDSPRSSAESSRRPSTPRSNGVNGFNGVNGTNGINGANGRERSDSRTPKHDSAELVTRRLKEALTDAAERSADYIKLDRAFVEAIILSLEQRREQVDEISHRLDTFKRKSQMMFDGLSAARNEYDQELAARRSAEVEVSRLKIELSGQAARITALTTDDRRREVQEKRSKELSEGLNGLEQEMSKLKVERDMTLAEVEELSASKAASLPNGEVPVASVSRSLTMRLDNIKRQYQHELVPLTQQRESLVREIADLKEARDIFLEETAVLNARNEELAQLNTQYEKRVEQLKEKSLPPLQPGVNWKVQQQQLQQLQAQAPAIVNTTSTSSTATLIDENGSSEGRHRGAAAAKLDLNSSNNINNDINGQVKRFRWPGNSGKSNVLGVAGAAMAGGGGESGKKKHKVEHAFQQLSILRFARCDLCGDKMWGSQVRCTVCSMSVHVRCVAQVHTSCTHEGSTANGNDDQLAPVGPPPPSMFGRDLIEQVRDDSKNSESLFFVPVIVTKCIEAVEANAMEYEGIYRKSGGSGQSKAITALFERGDYASFDLTDSEAFNDVSSITSVLKNYFRQLPNPLLTFGMHEAFVAAGNVKDLQIKGQALSDLVKQLPAEHYHTLAKLMLHLHAIQLHADVNLMNARNLGVVFGPTLMRSADPSREFADMAGKSLAIEYLIENAPSVFPSPS